MTIDLLLILLLHTKNNLRRHNPLIGKLEMQIRVYRKRSGIFEYVCRDLFFVHHVFHMSTSLIYA